MYRDVPTYIYKYILKVRQSKNDDFILFFLNMDTNQTKTMF